MNPILVNHSSKARLHGHVAECLGRSREAKVTIIWGTPWQKPPRFTISTGSVVDMSDVRDTIAVWVDQRKMQHVGPVLRIVIKR